jgi:hypothetical protein
MNMILVTYFADNLGMIRKGKVWMAMDTKNENFISFLLFIIHFCGDDDDDDDDDNNNIWLNFISNLFILMLPV